MPKVASLDVATVRKTMAMADAQVCIGSEMRNWLWSFLWTDEILQDKTQVNDPFPTVGQYTEEILAELWSYTTPFSLN